MNHQGTRTIETTRLILRKFTMDDAKASYQNWTSDEKVTKFLRWQTHADLAVTQSVLQSWISQYEHADFYQWAIILKERGEPIGTISVVGMHEKTEKIHIGYCIGSKWWHKGFTSEAFAAIIPFFFEEVGVKRIESQYDPENPNSGKVMKKCGLTYEGTLRKADWSNRGIVDACMYALLASEYFEAKSKKLP